MSDWAVEREAGGEVLIVYLVLYLFIYFVFFFKQKTAYEIVSRDWSSDVCSSDLFGLFHCWHAFAGSCSRNCIGSCRMALLKERQ